MSQTKKKVILTNKNGLEIGSMEKLKAHKFGKLHKAYSIFIYNYRNELLLQKRANQKYHSGGLWTNTCCSHPEPNDKRNIEEIAKERLFCEMGIFCNLKKITKFYYNVKVGNELIEHELSTILIGLYDDDPILNPLEASDYKWCHINDIILDIKKYPQKYTSWFKRIIKEEINIQPI